jgi:hypothetical protein
MLNRSTLIMTALLVAGTANLALAQQKTTTRQTTHTYDPSTRNASTNTTVTGPNGKQATRDTSTIANGNGSATHSSTSTGPNGHSASTTATYTNNGDGTITRSGSHTGVGGRTRFATTTAGNGGSTSSVTRRNGTVINRSRRRGA